MPGFTAGGSRVRAAGTASSRPDGTRHPLVAAAMVVPLAVLLVVAFGGWEQVVAHASSVAGMMGM